jgi:hypothetical protein
MKIGERLLKQISKKYEPSTLVRFVFNRYDVALKTDEDGNPVLLFIGKADERGIIKGNQFARRLLKNEAGVLLKDHWDYKGKI